MALCGSSLEMAAARSTRYLAAMQPLTRREILHALTMISFSAGALSGCGERPRFQGPSLPDQTPSSDLSPAGDYSDGVDALCDVLLPAQRDPSGRVLIPGGREAGADRVLQNGELVRFAVGLRLLPPLPETTLSALEDWTAQVRTTINRQLDVLTAAERPTSSFHEVPRETQERIVARAFDDDLLAPSMHVVRAACLIAYLGAIDSDVGLRVLGYPAFEDLGAGVAVRGYPRTRSGRLVDATKEDLRALARAGELDDYTYNARPAATPGDDLTDVLDERGDLR